MLCGASEISVIDSSNGFPHTYDVYIHTWIMFPIVVCFLNYVCYCQRNKTSALLVVNSTLVILGPFTFVRLPISHPVPSLHSVSQLFPLHIIISKSSVKIYSSPTALFFSPKTKFRLDQSSNLISLYHP